MRIRGRVINKNTRQPIANVAVTLLRRAGGSSSSGITQFAINLDADGEFDREVAFNGTADKFELVLDKDAGYKYKAMPLSLNPSGGVISRDLGVIEMEPYTD